MCGHSFFKYRFILVCIFCLLFWETSFSSFCVWCVVCLFWDLNSTSYYGIIRFRIIAFKKSLFLYWLSSHLWFCSPFTNIKNQWYWKNSLLTHIYKRKHAFREFLSFILKTSFIKKCATVTKHNQKINKEIWATSKTWTRTLDPDPEKPGPEKPGPRKTWTLKNLDPEKSGPWKTWTLKSVDPEKPAP